MTALIDGHFHFCGAAALYALPGPAREAVAQAARETEARQFAAIGTRLAENEARMRANGVEVASTPAALRAPRWPGRPNR